VKQIFAKILSCFVILTYVFGLSNYVTVQVSHYMHHMIEHTLNQHHSHSSNILENHTHSHNSFVDYSLFVEENRNEKESGNNATPVVSLDYFSHIICNKLTINNPKQESSNTYHNKSENLTITFAKPPDPPPRKS